MFLQHNEYSLEFNFLAKKMDTVLHSKLYSILVYENINNYFCRPDPEAHAYSFAFNLFVRLMTEVV